MIARERQCYPLHTRFAKAVSCGPRVSMFWVLVTIGSTDIVTVLASRRRGIPHAVDMALFATLKAFFARTFFTPKNHDLRLKIVSTACEHLIGPGTASFAGRYLCRRTAFLART